jgi:hypothetical protein
MRHVVRAAAQVYGKQGRLTLEADFERFTQDRVTCPDPEGRMLEAVEVGSAAG